MGKKNKHPVVEKPLVVVEKPLVEEPDVEEPQPDPEGIAGIAVFPEHDPVPECYFVSGHLDLTPEEYIKHYAPQILSALAEGYATFVVGDAVGCDERTQRLFKDAGLLDRLTVYHMKECPRVYVGEPARLLGGFRNDDDRDSAMTKASTKDIAWVREGREKSGTARNLARRRHPWA
jgi:hypothetical protein